MEGGINAWKGLVAEGAPESGMAYFSPASKPEELMALAWFLEDGSHKFYVELATALKEEEVKDLYKQLALEEEGHLASLVKLYEEFSGPIADPGFPRSLISSDKEGDIMEGGIRVSDALQWAEEKNVNDVLELCISLETNSYDLYIKMERQMKDQRSAQAFHLLSVKEKQHLERLSSLLEKRI